MDKVRLPKEVAEAIHSVQHRGAVSIMAAIARYEDFTTTTPEMATIHKYYKENPYILASAVINGYEVEQTPEDKIRELYVSARNAEVHASARGEVSDTQFYRGKMAAIPQVLDILNIKIEGVN